MLRRMRKTAGQSAAAVARDIGIDESYVSRVERGQRPVSDRIADHYARTFGDADALWAFVHLARGASIDRAQVTDPDLIAAQARYPIPGDSSEFVSEDPPDGITVGFGEVFQKAWTIRNSGTVPWIGRSLVRVGPAVGPWILSSGRFEAVPDTPPGTTVELRVDLRAPHIETAAVAQWKMADQAGLLCFPTAYSVGLAVQVVVVAHGASQA